MSRVGSVVRSPLLAVSAGVLLFAPVFVPPAHASAVPGATYRGTTSAGGSVGLVVSPDGTMVDSFWFSSVPLSCGGDWHTEGYGGNPISNDAFAYSEDYDTLAYGGSFTADEHANGSFSWANPFDATCGLQGTWTAAIQRTLTLTVSSVDAGTGSVDSSPDGLSCFGVGDCSASFDSGRSVTLTASPSYGSKVNGWTGCDSVSGATCTVAMNSDRAVGLTFGAVPPPPSLRPDLWFQKGSQRLGDGVYNTTAKNQSLLTKCKRGKTCSFVITIENDGTGNDTISVKGPGSTAAFGVRYMAGVNDVTKKVVAGTYRVQLPPSTSGFAATLRLLVTVKKSTAIGAAGSWLVVGTSMGSSTSRDAVKARVTAVS